MMCLLYTTAMNKTKSTTKENKDDDEGTLNGLRHGASRDKSPVSADDISSSSCKFRVYLNSQQHSTISHYLYWVQKFRNEVVAFCAERRKTRSIWYHQHPLLVSAWTNADMGWEVDALVLLPEEIAGSDVTAASKWLTKRLEQARLQVASLWNIQAYKKALRAAVYDVWVNLTERERQEIPDAWLLTVPRTVFDQCLQDMSKTYNKAIKDRSTGKCIDHKKNPGKNIKPAGFPQFQKHSYPYSVRFQIATAQNKTYVEAWNTAYEQKKKQIYIPSLGVITFRDAQDLPAIPPEMITLARNSSGQFHITFINKDPTSKTNHTLRHVNDHVLPQEKLYDSVLNQYVMVPVTIAGDLGLKTLVTYAQSLIIKQREEKKKEAKRIRFYQQQEKRLRVANKSVSRKKHGSKNWLKAKIKQGRVHTQTTNQRHEYLKNEARELVSHTAIVCLEDLNLRFLLQNKYLSKSAADASLGAFKRYIEWEAIKHGHLVIECGRFDATSKTCHACPYYYKDLTLNERSWTCPGCKKVLDRDENAAINIRHMALLKTIKGLEDGSIVITIPVQNSKNSQAKKGSSASGIGVPKKLSPYPLHKDLTAFIECGGLTSLLALKCVGESHAAAAKVVSASSEEAFILPKQSEQTCKERV